MAEELVRKDVRDIKDPDFVKDLGKKSLRILCHDLRTEIIRATSQYGGHLSSNLGDVELTVSLFRCFDFKGKDKLIYDVGHQAYAQKLLTGRSLDDLGGQGGSRFQSRAESPYDVYEAGHSSTSISAALAFAIREQEKDEKERGDVVVLIGDASIASGLAFEGLNNLAANKAKAIVVLNDNDMSISSPSGAMGRFFRRISSQGFYNKAKKAYQKSLSRTKFGRAIYRVSYKFKEKIKRWTVPTTLFDNLGLTYIGPVDGHSIKALDKAFKRAKNTTKTAIIHVYTKKGKGYEPAENDKNGLYHGVTPFDKETGAFKEGPRQWQDTMADLIEQSLENDDSVRVISPAMLVGSSLTNIYERFPKKCFDVGINEEHAATFAGALGLNGYKPILVVYSTFLQRAYDEILHDCARLKAPVTLLVDRAGPVGRDGVSHQGLYDVAFLSSIPNVLVTMPATDKEAAFLLDESLSQTDKVFAIRYPKETAVAENGDPALTGGRMRFLKEKGKCLVLAVGPRAKSLYDSLKTNKDIAFANPLYLNAFDPKDIEALSKYSKIAVYDSYGTEAGFAKNLSFALSQAGYKGEVLNLTFPNGFVAHGEIIDQLKAYGLDVETAADKIQAFLKA